MLRRQDFRRRHQGHLVSVLNRDDSGLECNDCLARPDVTLQKASHRRRLLHIRSDFLQDSFLRVGRMKWQYFLDGTASTLVKVEGDTALRLLLTPLQLQPQFGEEQFFEDKPNMRRRA